MLKFIGNGSAFNTKRINNSAFIKEGEDLLLIDCGESVFTELVEQGILKGVKNFHILITHFHPDHIGSLGSLIFYSHFILGVKAIVHYPKPVLMVDLLSRMGVSTNYYHITNMTGVINFPEIGRIDYKELQVPHAQEMDSYAYQIKAKGKMIYYSGDCNNIPDDIIFKIQDGRIDIAYQDTSQADYEGNIHLSVNRLQKLIKPEYRSKVWCMHLDPGFDIDAVEELGFNVTVQYRDWEGAE